MPKYSYGYVLIKQLIKQVKLSKITKKEMSAELGYLKSTPNEARYTTHASKRTLVLVIS